MSSYMVHEAYYRRTVVVASFYYEMSCPRVLFQLTVGLEALSMNYDFNVAFHVILWDICLAIINLVFSHQCITHLGLPFKNFLRWCLEFFLCCFTCFLLYLKQQFFNHCGFHRRDGILNSVFVILKCLWKSLITLYPPAEGLQCSLLSKFVKFDADFKIFYFKIKKECLVP